MRKVFLISEKEKIDILKKYRLIKEDTSKCEQGNCVNGDGTLVVTKEGNIKITYEYKGKFVKSKLTEGQITRNTTEFTITSKGKFLNGENLNGEGSVETKYLNTDFTHLQEGTFTNGKFTKGKLTVNDNGTIFTVKSDNIVDNTYKDAKIVFDDGSYYEGTFTDNNTRAFEFTSTAGETQNDFVKHHIESGGSKSIDVPFSAMEINSSGKVTNTKQLFGVEFENTKWIEKFGYLDIQGTYGSINSLELFGVSEDNFSESKKIIKLYVEGVTSLSSEIFDKSRSYIENNENLKNFIELSLENKINNYKVENITLNYDFTSGDIQKPSLYVKLTGAQGKIDSPFFRVSQDSNQYAFLLDYDGESIDNIGVDEFYIDKNNNLIFKNLSGEQTPAGETTPEPTAQTSEPTIDEPTIDGEETTPTTTANTPTAIFREKKVKNRPRKKINLSNFLSKLKSGLLEIEFGLDEAVKMCAEEFRKYSERIKIEYNKTTPTVDKDLDTTKKILSSCWSAYNKQLSRRIKKSDITLIENPPGNVLSYAIDLNVNENIKYRDIYSKQNDMSQTIKNIIKEHSIKKEKQSIVESSIIKNRLNFVFETNGNLSNRTNIKKKLIEEKNELLSMGYNEEIVNNTFKKLMYRI